MTFYFLLIRPNSPQRSNSSKRLTPDTKFFPNIDNNKNDNENKEMKNMDNNFNKTNIYGNSLNRPASQPSGLSSLFDSSFYKNPRPYTANSYVSNMNMKNNPESMIIIPPMIKKVYSQETNTDICDDDASEYNASITHKNYDLKNRSYNHIIQFNPNRNSSEKSNDVDPKTMDFIQILRSSKNPLLDIYQVSFFLYFLFAFFSCPFFDFFQSSFYIFLSLKKKSNLYHNFYFLFCIYLFFFI